MNDTVKPASASRLGLILNKKLETSIEKMGEVLTRTVAFRIVVSFTADTKNMKCKPRKKLRMRSSFAFFLTKTRLNGLLATISIAVRAKQAIMIRQKAIENASKPCRNLMKMAAVPKRMPAAMPSVKASSLVLIRI
jgi:hypothetical protein